MAVPIYPPITDADKLRYHPFERVYEPWEEWYAWYPVKINNKWVWLKPIYRRLSFLWGVPRGNSNYYEYGTIFDVLGQN